MSIVTLSVLMEAIYLKIMTNVMDATNEIGGGAYSTP
jgi:hypothetical protein